MRTSALRQQRPGNYCCRCGGCDGLEEPSTRELRYRHVGRIIEGRATIEARPLPHLLFVIPEGNLLLPLAFYLSPEGAAASRAVRAALLRARVHPCHNRCLCIPASAAEVRFRPLCLFSPDLMALGNQTIKCASARVVKIQNAAGVAIARTQYSIRLGPE